MKSTKTQLSLPQSNNNFRQDLNKMPYAGLQMLMDNLKKLIHGNHHPLFNNNPKILSETPQFQLLYQEVSSIIKTLSIINQHHHHQHHELEKVGNLKKRFKDATEEAEDIIDLFLSGLHFRNRELSPRSGIFKTSLIFLSCLPFRNIELSHTDVFKTSLDLKNVMRSINSIKVEFMAIDINNMKMDSSPRIDTFKTKSTCDASDTSNSSTRSSLRTKKQLEEIVVGLDHDAEIIRDKLAEDTKQLSIVSIVGMGGLGKTTLATKLFNDRFFKYHFHIRAWATVSQTYEKRDLLIQILTSIGVQLDLEKDNDSKLREKLHKNLMGRRYLIVIDDIWSVDAWDDLKVLFPNDNTGSRILLTSRLNEVALHVKPHGFVHSLPCLTEEESWELLKQKVFHGDECPEWLIKPGMKIAKKCQGLPLSVVVIAGVLAKQPMSKNLWEKIACGIGSYIVNDHKGNLETLALSYHHLPDHLRECFLYLGGFPEDFEFVVERLIWLWVAEGFIEEAENRCSEDTAKAYLMDLINRNLVIVAERNLIGDVKACKLHDLVRELCVQKAKEERFFLKIDSVSSASQLYAGILYQQRRLFTNRHISIVDYTHFRTKTIRSLLCFHKDIFSVEVIARSFVLLRVLDLQKCRLHYFTETLALLVHLRYLAISSSSRISDSICKLWSLQTLILQTFSSANHLPHNIPELVNLRHLRSNIRLYLPYIGKPMNLQSISTVVLKHGIDHFLKCFPSIKKLALYCNQDEEYRFELLSYLETLKLKGLGLQWNRISYPTTLKKLTLVSCFLPWSHMSVIQLLPNLEVLKLKKNALMGRRWDGCEQQWNACEQQFRQLKLLMLQSLDIKQWEASSTSFPCLKQLSLWDCVNLEEIPLEIGEISTLELIEADSNNKSVVESVKRIQQEQHDEGNYELKITLDGMELSFYSSQHEGSESE